MAKVGRPSKGTTKKISVTLTDDVWEMVEQNVPNKSEFFRNLVMKEIYLAEEWEKKIDGEVN